VTATTFDPARKTSQTLSAGNLTATSTGAGGVYTTRPLQGKSYFELTPSTITGTPSVGLCAGSWNTSTALQSGLNTIGYLGTGAVQINGVTLSTIAAWAAGNRIDFAVDPGSFLLWARVAGGNWNNNVANDPATGVGGIDYSSAFTQLGTLWPAVYASLTGTVWNAAFTSGSFAGTPPSGYSSLDSVLYTRAVNVDAVYEGNPASAQYFGPASRNLGDLGRAAQLVVMPPGSGGKSISGVVQDNGTPISGKTVRVYDEATGAFLGGTTSDGSGLFTLSGLPPGTVYAVAIDPPYDALIFDQVTPV
jgi:hypothetical protein